MRAAPSARARTSCSATRTWCTRASCRTIRGGRSCSRTCDFVVIDELHAYRGVFGSHLTNVLRRLQRICRHYGSNPQFICSSATIANPAELADRLAEKPFELVEKSGAPRGEKFFVFVNPPVVNRELGIRRSYIAESRRVAGEFLRRNLQVIVFAQSRLSTEILTTYLKEDFEDVPGMPERIRGYRGGYLPLRRREIEKGLRAGQVRGVVSTNALELGIDIGALDVCVMAGYPGTIASTWQRAGRAGRRSGQSAAVMVASSAPIDQFVARHPSFFFDASPEHALVNPDNLHILVDHVKCAAFELPFTTEESYGLVDVQDVLGVLQESGLVHRSGRRGRRRAVALDERVVSGQRGEPAIDFVRQLRHHRSHRRREGDWRNRLHQRALDAASQGHLHGRGQDLPGRGARLRRTQGARQGSGLRLLHDGDHLYQGHDPRSLCRGRCARSRSTAKCTWCRASSVSRRSVSRPTRTSARASSICPSSRCTRRRTGSRFRSSILNALPYATDDRRDGVIGLAFAMKQVAQLLLMCDARDIGLSVNAGEDGDGRRRRPASDTPRIFIYDAYPGGIGFSAPLWRHAGGAAVEDERADRRLRLRQRLPDVRRSDRRDRTAGQDRGAANPRSICCAARRCALSGAALAVATERGSAVLAWRRSIDCARSSGRAGASPFRSWTGRASMFAAVEQATRSA